MDGNSIAQFLHEWLGAILDTGLIFGFFLLWLSWFRNGKRQHRLEKMLMETSGQLEEATRHLSQATQAIEHLRQQGQSARRAAGRDSADHLTPDPPQPARSASVAPAATTLPQKNSTQATMILRMHREGESPQTIAERLDMPLAQIKLLLKLHAVSGATG